MISYGLYDSIIQETYLSLTHAFYTRESDARFNNGIGADEFLQHIQGRSREEFERAHDVLVDSSVNAVRDTTESALLANRLQWLAKDGSSLRIYLGIALTSVPSALALLMEKRNDVQLKKMYKLYAKVGDLKVLSASFKTHVQVCDILSQHTKDVTTPHR